MYALGEGLLSSVLRLLLCAVGLQGGLEAVLPLAD